MRRYGPEAAKDIWDAPCHGIERIVSGIKKFDIECGLLAQDSLFLGLGKDGKEEVESEAEYEVKLLVKRLVDCVAGIP